MEKASLGSRAWTLRESVCICVPAITIAVRGAKKRYKQGIRARMDLNCWPGRPSRESAWRSPRGVVHVLWPSRAAVSIAEPPEP